MNFQTCLPPLKPGIALLNLSLVYAPFPSLTTLQIAPQTTLLMRRLNASILCLLPNLVSPTPHSLYPSFPVIPNCSWIHTEVEEGSFNPRLWLCNFTGWHLLTCHKMLLCCSFSSSHYPFTLSFPLGHVPSAWKSTNITVLHLKVQILIPFTAEQLAYFHHHQGHRMHHGS